MNAQRVVSLVLLSSVMVSGICFGAPLLTFFDATSFALFIGVVGGGILWSHSLSDVTAAFGTFLGSSTVDPEQSQRDHNTFVRLAELSSAVCWIGPIIGIIQILHQVDDPSAVGPGMAIVLLTMLYGTAAGELLFRPAAAACLTGNGSSTEASTGPMAFHSRKLISVLIVSGLIFAGLSLSGKIQYFFNIPSLGIVVLATFLGLFVSHPASNVRRILRWVFGPETMHPNHAEESATMFHRLAELAVATGFLGTIIGLVQMLQNLADPLAIGPALGVACLTLFYGFLLSEVAFRTAATDCLRRGGVHIEDWRQRHPGRALAIVGQLLFVTFTFALVLISMGLNHL